MEGMNHNEKFCTKLLAYSSLHQFSSVIRVVSQSFGKPALHLLHFAGDWWAEQVATWQRRCRSDRGGGVQSEAQCEKQLTGCISRLEMSDMRRFFPLVRTDKGSRIICVDKISLISENVSITHLGKTPYRTCLTWLVSMQHKYYQTTVQKVKPSFV